MLDFIQSGGGLAGIFPASSGASNASCIGFQKLGSPQIWEIWNGVQFEGRSGAAHEFDLAIVPHQVGSGLRLIGGQPFGRPRVAVECKDVTASGSIDEMRTIVARLHNVTILKVHRFHLRLGSLPQVIYPANFGGEPYHDSRDTYRDENLHIFNVFARRTGFAKVAAATTGYYYIQPYGGVTAGSLEADALFGDIANWIDANLPYRRRAIGLQIRSGRKAAGIYHQRKITGSRENWMKVRFCSRAYLAALGCLRGAFAQIS